jgi:hypothetical protein
MSINKAHLNALLRAKAQRAQKSIVICFGEQQASVLNCT